MSRYHRLFVFVIALTIAAALINAYVPMKRGLDIAGGIRVVLEVDPKKPADWPKLPAERQDKINSVRKIIQERVKGLGSLSEAVAQVQNPRSARPRVVVEIPGVKDPQKALEIIQSTASLEFYYMKNLRSDKNPIAPWKVDSMQGDEKTFIFTGPRGQTLNSSKKEDQQRILTEVVGVPKVEPILTGEQLLPNADTGVRQGTQQVVINIQFNDEGAKVFRDFTRDHVYEYLAVFYDGKLLTCPTINEPIPDGKAEISGFASLTEARMTADVLNAGALPVPLKIIGQDSVEPSLGADTVNKVLVAGILGLVLVIGFMLLYYRLPGFLADLALGLYALFTFAVFKAIGATMSLPGLAAVIISIGMAVDANILIFERLKEELRSGKTLRAAIDAGFNRAFTAIFDSNMCTAITCAILYWMGAPSVQNFAFTLVIGVAISMFTAITVTRTFLHLLVGWEWAQNPSLYGLGTSWIARMGLNVDIVGKRAYYFLISAILIVPGLIVLATSGLNLGIEFMSGTTLQARFEQKPASLEAVREVVEPISKGSKVQLARPDRESKGMAFITTRLLSEDKDFAAKVELLRSRLDAKFGLVDKDRDGEPRFGQINSVGPSISKELTSRAIIAVIIASVGIVLYLAGRFAIGGLAHGVKYGVCAVIALIHDTAFILGMFAILGKYAGWETDGLFVTAVLTIIGFSVHDTIVVFDRIRENLRHRQRGETFEQLANRSILQTFSRSINTGFAVILSLCMLIAFGGPLLRQFYITLLVGILIGTYSSIFNATPLVVVWERLASGGKAPKRKEFEAKPMVSQPMTAGLEQPEAGNGSETAVDGTSEEDKPGAASSARIKRKKPKKRF